VFPLPIASWPIVASLIGAIGETQERSDRSSTTGIISGGEMTRAGQISTVYRRMLTSCAKYGFVVDIAGMT
jgi:D-arabinose 1-dehydrogenase-like Zn-dependent alcohol dehydrogenase